MLNLAAQRLHDQRLTQPTFQTPGEVVASFGAVQAQDYLGAKWSLGMRMQTATDDVIERAFNAGEILRTHVMRPTWHFFAPGDIRWLLELTAPRVTPSMPICTASLNWTARCCSVVRLSSSTHSKAASH